MIRKEILLAPGATSGQGEAPIEYVDTKPIMIEDTETINFNEAKNLFANLNTNEILESDTLKKYGHLTTGELLATFGELSESEKYISLEDIDMDTLKQELKIYSNISYYAYKAPEASDEDPDYIKKLLGYPLEEPDYTLAAEYDKKAVDLLSLVLTGTTIVPGENYGKFESQIISFIDHVLQRFDQFITEDQNIKINRMIKDLNGAENIGKTKFEYDNISDKEREEYKGIITKVAKQTGYLTLDFKRNKAVELYFPITEKYNLLVQILSIITGDHSKLARALTIEGSLLDEKIRYIPLDRSENMQRAIEIYKQSEEESKLAGRYTPGQSENNIGEIYFNVEAYLMALMSYEESLERKREAYKDISNKLDRLENYITETNISLTEEIKQNKKENIENEIPTSELDKYFLDYEDASSDFVDMLASFEEKVKKHKSVNTEAFTQTAKDISLSTKTIEDKLNYLKKNDKYIDKTGLEKIQKHLVELSDLLYEFSKIINIDAPYINIGKSNIVMGIQTDNEEMLQKGKEYLDIAEEFQNLSGNDDAEVNYYLGEYYKFTRDFRKAQEYFLKVYDNPNADIEYRYKAASGLKYTSFTRDKKFEREGKEKEMEKTYREISQRIQNSMNEYASVVAAEEKNANKIEEQRLKQEQRDALIKQRSLGIGGGVGILFIMAGLWLRSMNRKKKIIEAQKEEVEEKNVEVEQKNEQITKEKEKVERVTGAVNKSGQAVLIKTSDGKILFSNEVYRNILEKDIVSERGNMDKMFKEVIETGEERKFKELVVWNIDQTKLSKEEKQEIEEERNKSASKYLFLKEDGKEIIREQRYYKITLTPSLDDAGNVTEVSSISDDATKEEIDKKEKEKQKIEIEFKNAQIEGSITYGKKIQAAMLPSKEQMKQLGEHFVYYKPKDIISGDFYWVKECKDDPNKVVVATVDCTGHGVPGAMMSMLGMSNLDDIRNTNSKLSPAEILEELHRRIKLALQKSEGHAAQDGMDLSLYILDKSTGELQYSGAMNELYIIDIHGELTTLEPTKRGINDTIREKKSFQNHTLQLEKGTTIYSHSDGYQDQFGGPESRKFMKRQYRELLQEIYNHPVERQQEILDGVLEKRRGNEIQMDDIIVMGVKV